MVTEVSFSSTDTQLEILRTDLNKTWGKNKIRLH